MEIEAQVFPARSAWLYSVSKQFEKLLREPGGVQDEIPIRPGR